jgi:hypothetical protein
MMKWKRYGKKWSWHSSGQTGEKPRKTSVRIASQKAKPVGATSNTL